MNIEQEFKELHELLLCAYDEDYEESLDKALSKLDNLKKQLLLHNVSQQRELLKGYEEWLENVDLNTDRITKIGLIDRYLKTL